MTAYFVIHPINPQLRLIRNAVEVLHKGGIVVYPTDSGYGMGCEMGNKAGAERIRQIRKLEPNHHFTLLCRDFSEISTVARVDNASFRLLKANTPGAYTFILPATKEVPNRLLHPKKQTIGIRIPDHPVTLLLLEELNAPLMSVTLILPGETHALSDMDEIRDQLEGRVDLIMDGGSCGIEPTTIVDLTTGSPKILREGKGDIAPFAF